MKEYTYKGHKLRDSGRLAENYQELCGHDLSEDLKKPTVLIGATYAAMRLTSDRANKEPEKDYDGYLDELELTDTFSEELGGIIAKTISVGGDEDPKNAGTVEGNPTPSPTRLP